MRIENCILAFSLIEAFSKVLSFTENVVSYSCWAGELEALECGKNIDLRMKNRN